MDTLDNTFPIPFLFVILIKLAEHCGKSPDKITEEDIRGYFLNIRNEKKYSSQAQKNAPGVTGFLLSSAGISKRCHSENAFLLPENPLFSLTDPVSAAEPAQTDCKTSDPAP